MKLEIRSGKGIDFEARKYFLSFLFWGEGFVWVRRRHTLFLYYFLKKLKTHLEFRLKIEYNSK